MNEKQLLGSRTAKGGFRNEYDVIARFNDWKNDSIAQDWLTTMGYSIKSIESVNAIKIKGSFKTDVQVQITIKLKGCIDCENLSVKLVSNPCGFNQVDKRDVDNYVALWAIPKNIEISLKLFTGRIKPPNPFIVVDSRRMYLTEMSIEAQKEIVDFFNKHKILIVSDILKGRGKLAAGWMLVILKIDGEYKWVLKDINTTMNIFGQGKVEITKKGSLKIGEITMQRKGGDGGRDSANMLQFKINPCLLFD